jgi:hypothetical protein
MAVILSYSPRSRETAGALRHYLHGSTEAALHLYVDGLRAQPFSGEKGEDGQALLYRYSLTAGISPPLPTDVGAMRPGRRSRQHAKQQSSMSRSGERGMLLIRPLAAGILTRLKS